MGGLGVGVEGLCRYDGPAEAGGDGGARGSEAGPLQQAPPAGNWAGADEGDLGRAAGSVPATTNKAACPTPPALPRPSPLPPRAHPMLEPFYLRLMDACRKAGDTQGADSTRKQWLRALAEHKRAATRQSHQPPKKKNAKAKKSAAK